MDNMTYSFMLLHNKSYIVPISASYSSRGSTCMSLSKIIADHHILRFWLHDEGGLCSCTYTRHEYTNTHTTTTMLLEVARALWTPTRVTLGAANPVGHEKYDHIHEYGDQIACMNNVIRWHYLVHRAITFIGPGQQLEVSIHGFGHKLLTTIVA